MYKVNRATIFKIRILCILITFWNICIIMFTNAKSLPCHAFVLSHLILKTILCGRNYYPYITDEKLRLRELIQLTGSHNQ